MSGLRITIDDTKQAVERLLIAHQLPKGTTLESVARGWVECMGDVEPGELKVAVTDYLRGKHKWFPKPADVREAALAYRRRVNGAPADEYRDWLKAGGTEGPCPVCGSVLRRISRRDMGQQTMGRKGRPATDEELDAAVGFGVVHSFLTHQRKGVRVVGYHDGPKTGDQEEHRGQERTEGLRRAGGE